MSSIDERIVKMTFDNDKFEAGVRKTMETLEKLKEKLTFKDHDKTFKGIETSMNNVNFQGIESGVESLQKRFSTLGIIGMEVTKRITNAAIDAGKKLIGATLGQAKTGGMTRSLNIEQARFQLEGLLKDGAKVEAVMQAASNAVDGTAYGLDEAAKAASVLAASGITDATRLENVLKSVAGGAAMTGRGFSDIADIYSTVASNGKLMTMQLRQFAASGLNVSAVLAEKWGTTEEVINEAVRKGEIDFDEFSEAMMRFSDQAGKANDTFSGSLSNMKSAINRIGQTFTDPYVDNMKYVFNAARLGLNEVNKQLKLFSPEINKAVESGKNFIVGVLEKLTGGFDTRGDYVYGGIGKATQGLIYIFQALWSAIKPIGTAFKEMFPGVTVDNLNKLITRFRDWTITLKLNERQANNMRWVYKGIFSVFKLIVTVVGNLIAGINRLLKPFGGLLNIINFILGLAGRIIYVIATVITKVRLLSRIFTVVTTVISAALTGIVWVIKQIVKVLQPVYNLVIKIVTTLWNLLGRIFHGVVGTIQTALAGVSDGFKRFINIIKNSAPFITLSRVFTRLFDIFKYGISVVGSLFDRLNQGEGVISKLINSKISSVLNRVFEVLAAGVVAALDAIVRLGRKLRDLFNTFKQSKTATTLMKGFTKAVNATKDALKSLVDRFKTFSRAIIDWIKEHHLVQAFFTAIKLAIVAVVGAFVLVIAKIREFILRVKEFLDKKGLIETFSNIFHKGLEKIKEALEFVIEKIKKFAEMVQSHIKNPLNDIGDSADSARDKLKSMVNLGSMKGGLKTLGGYLVEGVKQMSGVVPILKDIAKNILGIFGDIVSYAKTFISNFLGSLKGMDTKTILDYFPYEAFGVFLLALSRFVSKGAKVSKSLTGMFDSVSGMFGALTERLKGGSKMQKAAKTLLTFAIALGIFALAVGYLSKMEPEKLKKGLISATVGVVAITGALIVIGKVLDKMKNVNFAQIGVGLLAISIGMLILTAAVKKFGEMDTTQLLRGFAGVAAALTMLTMAVKYGLGDAQHMASTGFGLLLIAGALLAFAGVVLIFNKIDWAANAKGIFAVVIGLGILTTAVRIMGNAHVKGVALAILAMTASMLILVVAIKALSKIDTTSLAVSMGGLAAMLIIMAGALKILSNNESGVKNAALSIVLLAAGLGVLSYAIYQLAKCDLDGLQTSFIGLAGMLAVMAIALYALANNSGLDSAARNLVIVAAGLSILALAISAMASMPLEGLKTSLIGLTGMLAVMAISLYALAQLPTADLTTAAAAMVILAAGIGVLSLAIGYLAQLPTKGLIAAMIALGVALIGMVAAGHAAEACSAGLIMLSVAFVAFGAAVYLVSQGVAIVVKAFADGASKLLPLVEKIREIINDVFSGICDVITSVGDAIATVVDSISSGISGVLDSVAGVFDSMGKAAKRAGEGVKLIADGIAKLTNLKLGDMAATLGKVADALDDFSENSKEMSTTGEGVRDMANGLQKVATFGNLTATAFTILSAAFNILKPALDGIPQALTTAASAFSSFSSNLLTFGIGIGVAISSVVTQFQAFNQSVTSVTSSIIALTAVSSIVSMVMSVVVATTNMARVALDGLRSGAGKVGASLSTIGLNASLAGAGLTSMSFIGIAAMSKLTSAISNGGNKAKTAMSSSIASIIASARSQLNNLGSIGTSAMGRFASGIRSGSLTVKSAAVSVVSSMTSTITSSTNSLYSAGYSCAVGFANGIRSGIYLARDAGSSIGKAALQAAKSAVDSHSPSKEFMKLGKDIDLGLIIGIQRLSNKVYKTSYDMGKEAIDAVSDPMKKIYDILNQDLDMSPTISPVLDLSNVDNGINQLNNMLNTRQLSANVSTNMSKIGLIPAYAGATNNSIENNTTNTFNITVDGAENPEAFADRLVRQFQLRGRMS